jgi:hypothetical protein
MTRSNRTKKTSPGRGANVTQLREQIDQGRSGDKVSHVDPSAAPLGTDDESAGQPPTTEQVTLAMARERGQAARARGIAGNVHGSDTASGHRRLAGPAVWLLLIFVVAVLAVLFFVLPT